jgi:hypothetical protein
MRSTGLYKIAAVKAGAGANLNVLRSKSGASKQLQQWPTACQFGSRFRHLADGPSEQSWDVTDCQDGGGVGSRYSLAILCPLLEPDRIEGTFKRVGIVEVPILSGFAVKEWEIRTVMIV